MLENLIDDSDGFNVLVKSRYGYLLTNKNDRFLGRAVQYYGECNEIELRHLGRLCGPNDVVMDVGANIGNHSLYFARRVGRHGRVLSFEPQRILFQTLCANMALNSILQVDCFHAACGDREGQVTLPEIRYDVESNFGGIGIAGGRARGEEAGGERVPLIRLDRFEELPRLDLMKIEVEGMEHEVLSGAARLIRRFRPFLFVENDRVNRSERLIELILSFDYRLYWCITPIFNPDDYAGQRRIIFGPTHVYNMLCVPDSRDAPAKGLPEITNPSEHPLASRRSGR